MKKVRTEYLKSGCKLLITSGSGKNQRELWFGEVVTHVSWPFIMTTAQRQVDESEAATFAYLIEGNKLEEFVKLRKHPTIKGSRARKALGA